MSVRFHLSLNVADLSRSVAFYRALFGVEPAKLRSDYAKFEPADPALVLSLEPTARPVGGPLNHLGFRFATVAELVATQERLAVGGIATQREDGVECCYAKQTKFWVHDPDGTLWEFYTLDGDIEHRGAGQSQEAVQGSTNEVVWEHRLGTAVPAAIPLADASADEVRLRGTFNAPVDAADAERLLAETKRVLKPGGKVFVHVLTTDRALDGPPALPGPAGAVSVVPLLAEPMAWLERGGFGGVRLVKYDADPCFRVGAANLRETKIEGWLQS